MTADSIARIASLIGEAGRIRMLSILLDGDAHSASELATAADVSPQTASSHLSKLLSGGLIASQRSGRQRLFRLKNRDVAAAIEALGALAHDPATPALPEIRFARTCYDHLAGVLAIAVRNELLRQGALLHRADAFHITAKGKRLLRSLDLDFDALSKLRRSFAHPCLDWTERHHHIGGAVGAALLSCFMQRNWLARVRGSRAVRITHAGERGFEQTFGIRCAALRVVPPNAPANRAIAIFGTHPDQCHAERSRSAAKRNSGGVEASVYPEQLPRVGDSSRRIGMAE